MLKPGPKSKGDCPADVHIRLNETQRKIIESLGAGSAQDKIINLIVDQGRKIAPPSQIEVQMNLITLGKEIKCLIDQERELKRILETQFGLSETEIEKAYEQIQKAIHGVTNTCQN